MRYTEPTIVNVFKAAPMIMGQFNKKVDISDTSSPITRSDPAAYEADE